MQLRARRRDAITDVPVSAHRGITLNGSLYDITTVMHLCHEAHPKDPITQTLLSAADRERIRTRCDQIGVTPKRRRLPYDHADADTSSDGAVEFHVDALLDAIQEGVLWTGCAPVAYLDRLATLLRSVRGRNHARGQYLIDIVLRQLTNALRSHASEPTPHTHPILVYLQLRL